MIRKIFIVLISLFMTTIYAQNDSIKNLDEVTITASRFKLEAVSAKTIQMDSVKDYFAQETPYFFSRTPSIISQSDNGTPFGYSYFSLRGMGQNRINYTLNGVPLNDGEDLAVYTSNFTDLLSSLRSVQIIRGAGISSNGASSYVGLVNMDLSSPFDTKLVEFNSMMGSFNSRRNSVKFNTGVSKKGFGATFRASETYTDGFRDYSSGKSLSLSTSLGYKTDVTSIRFNAIFGKTKNGQSWLPVPEGLPVTTNILATDFGIRPQYDDFTSGIYQLQIAGKFSEQTLFNLSTYYTHIDGNYDMPAFNGYPDINNLKLNSSNWGTYYNAKYSNNGLTIQPGFTVNSYKRKHVGRTNDIFQYENLGEKIEATAFTKASYKLGLDWIVEGDYQFRNTTFNYKNEIENFGAKLYEYNFHNYSFGLSYRRFDTFKPYISFSRSSREPSRTNIFLYTDNPTSENEITNVRPETVNDLELGTKINTKNLKGTINVYSMRFNNEIVSIGQLNSMGISLGTNAKSSSRVGLEGDLTFTKNKFETGFTFNVSRNRILLDDKTSNPVLTPNFNSNLFISYKINKFDIGSNYKYVAQSFLDTDNDFICPEYHLIDLNFNYNLDSKFSIRFFVNNILDRNWTTGGTASPDFGRSFYYTSGVNFFMNVNYKL